MQNYLSIRLCLRSLFYRGVCVLASLWRYKDPPQSAKVISSMFPGTGDFEWNFDRSQMCSWLEIQHWNYHRCWREIHIECTCHELQFTSTIYDREKWMLPANGQMCTCAKIRSSLSEVVVVATVCRRKKPSPVRWFRTTKDLLQLHRPISVMRWQVVCRVCLPCKAEWWAAKTSRLSVSVVGNICR